MPVLIHYPKQAVQKFLEDRFPDTDWSTVFDQMPEIIWRHRWDAYAESHGLPYKRSYLQNLDHLGIGPKSFM